MFSSLTAKISSHSGDIVESDYLLVLPRIDGTVDSIEWSDARHYTISSIMEMYIKNDETDLYLAFIVSDVENWNDALYLFFDEGQGGGEHDGKFTFGDEDFKWSSAWGGFEDLFWEGVLPAWFEPDRDYNGSIDGRAAWDYYADHWEIEWKLPLDSSDELDINVVAGTTVGMRIAYWDEEDFLYSVVWPEGSNRALPQTYGDLHLSSVIRVPRDYLTIQEAINAANPGDAIFVYNGTYHEHVVIQKDILRLLGQNRDNTIIDADGTGSAVRITANNVIVANFTVRNSGPNYPDSGIYLNSSSFCSITENMMINNFHGILLEDSSENTLGNNIGTGNRWGILLPWAPDNTLRENNLTDNVYNFGVWGTQTSDYLQRIDTTNTVNGKPVYYLINQKDLKVNPSTHPNAGYLALINSTRITVENLTLTSNDQGILFAFTTNSSIFNSDIKNNDLGILLTNSAENIISNNYIDDNWFGIASLASSNNIICQNVITSSYIGIEYAGSSNGQFFSNNVVNNHYGIMLWWSSSSGNKIYHNNLINNEIQVDITYQNPVNTWDDGYPSGGNYWSDYAGGDLKSGPNQDQSGTDGIGDTPYIIDTDNRDRYPFMNPFACIVKFECNPKTPRATEGIEYNASASYSQNGNITSYEWNFEDGNITTVTEPLINHTYTEEGNYTVALKITDEKGWSNSTTKMITVTYETDVNRDETVNIMDIALVAKAYGTKEGDPNWNVIADLDDNGIIDIRDIAKVAKDYGKTV